MINIIKAELLGVNHTYDFWGNGFNYRNVQDLSIRGKILSSTEQGIKEIWQQSSGLIYDDWENININNIDFGSGRIVGINFGEGLDVRQKTYTIDLQIYKTGCLHNLSGCLDLNFNLEELAYVENLNETFDFNQEEDGSYSYDRSLSFGVKKGKDQNTVTIAKSIANTLFNNAPTTRLVTANYPNFYVNSGQRYHNETYNLIGHTYSFAESFRFRDGENYNWDYTHELTYSEDGIVSLNEVGNIVGLDSNPYLAASGAFNTIKTNIFNRVSGVYNSYASGMLSSGCPLTNLPNKSVSADKCVGTINYNYEYSNDPRLSASGYSWEYSQNFSRDDNGLYAASEQGVIIGYADDREQALTNALNGYSGEISTNIRPRVQAAFTGMQNLLLDNGCTGNSSFVKTDRTFDISEFNSSVSYTNNYNNDPTLITGDPNFTRVVVSTTDQQPTHKYNSFIAPHNKEIYQSSQTSNLGKFIYNVQIQGKKGTTVDQYLDKAFTYISKPSATVFSPVITSDTHIEDMNYDFSPTENEFTLNLTYAYNWYRKFNDILIR